jgi:hypothetical protein
LGIAHLHDDDGDAVAFEARVELAADVGALEAPGELAHLARVRVALQGHGRDAPSKCDGVATVATATRRSPRGKGVSFHPG